MKRTNIYLDESQTEALDELAHAQGVSRAEVIRRMVDRSLASTGIDLEADLAAIEESAGVLRDDEFVEIGDGERAAYLDRLRQP